MTSGTAEDRESTDRGRSGGSAHQVHAERRLGEAQVGVLKEGEEKEIYVHGLRVLEHSGKWTSLSTHDNLLTSQAIHRKSMCNSP